MALWTPADTTTALWLDGADSATVFDAVSGGSTPLDGARIARWEDKSSNSRHFTQSSSTFQPLRNVAIDNGKDATTFDGTNDRMEGPKFSLSNASVFIVLRRTGAGTYQVPFKILTAASLTAIEVGLNNDTNYGPVIIGSNPSSTPFGKGGALLNDTLRMISGTWTGPSTSGAANYKLWSNGTSFALANSTNIASSGGTYSSLGAGWSPGPTLAGFFNGRINELVVIDDVASTGLRQQIEGYLAWKWGLEGDLPIGHPYKSAAPATGNPAGILQLNTQSMRFGL